MANVLGKLFLLTYIVLRLTDDQFSGCRQGIPLVHIAAVYVDQTIEETAALVLREKREGIIQGIALLGHVHELLQPRRSSLLCIKSFIIPAVVKHRTRNRTPAV